MLWTLLVFLLVLWVLGLLTNVVGGLIHILLVLAVIVLLYQLLTGRRVT
ncbi:MAG TPA: lmo0937 family membrane protein [Candidatus Limnocylindrales bacterium]|nr:lmo0937 family membrane protein [Candidatus Limnocylindrales bacterium]